MVDQTAPAKRQKRRSSPTDGSPNRERPDHGAALTEVIEANSRNGADRVRRALHLKPEHREDWRSTRILQMIRPRSHRYSACAPFLDGHAWCGRGAAARRRHAWAPSFGAPGHASEPGDSRSWVAAGSRAHRLRGTPRPWAALIFARLRARARTSLSRQRGRTSASSTDRRAAVSMSMAICARHMRARRSAERAVIAGAFQAYMATLRAGNAKHS